MTAKIYVAPLLQSFFHETSDAGEAGEPSHNQFVSGHIQTSVEISGGETTESSFAPVLGRAQRGGSHSIPQ